MAHEILTAQRLRELLHYDPDTGVLQRISGSATRPDLIGHRFGCAIKQTGYREGWVGGRKYLEHRLIWLYMTGEWPADQVDHRNRVRDDNRWDNLRAATNGQNQMNLGGLPKRNNKLGVLGVSRNKGRFSATIRVDGVYKHIGTFDTPALAHAAYMVEKRTLHGGWGVE